MRGSSMDEEVIHEVPQLDDFPPSLSLPIRLQPQPKMGLHPASKKPVHQQLIFWLPLTSLKRSFNIRTSDKPRQRAMAGLHALPMGKPACSNKTPVIGCFSPR